MLTRFRQAAFTKKLRRAMGYGVVSAINPFESV